ncbi:MAG: ATP-binding cassette domain-containing protein [Chthoniobacter sp.]|nr:ATP-binding cassette domain-containing protein [Chthoniobacter sp.]
MSEPAPKARRGLHFDEIRALLAYVHPWRGRFALALTALTVSMIFGLMFPLLVGYLVDAAVPSIAPAPGGWSPNVNTVALLLVGTLAIQAVLTFFYSYAFNFVGENAVARLRRRLYETLIGLPMKFFGEHRVGELTSRLSSDLSLMGDTLCGTIPQALRQTIMLLGGVVAITATSPRLSLVMVSTFPVLLIVAVFVGRKVRRVSREAQDRLAESATIVEETLQGIANVKSFANEAYEARRYGAGVDAYLQTVLSSARRRAGLVAFIILGIFGSIILVLWYGATLMKAGQLTHGQLTRFTLYTLFVGGAVSSFAEVFSQLQRTLGANERVHELLQETGELPSGTTAPAAKTGLRLRGAVAFENVVFSYPSRMDLPVLRGLSLVAEPGQRIALVGPSGAGKSTLVSLLLRFYTPDSGRIRLDGEDVQLLDLATLRANMAIVPQEVMLFGGSIRENIAYGRVDASEAEIRAAAERAHCSEFIARFPEGYDTLVGERGVKLSGGQRQRLAIARALLINPAVLVLDEATSALDAESEAIINANLMRIAQDRTIICISHRLSMLVPADAIMVLERGKVYDIGRHEELLHRCDIYKHLWQTQNRHTETRTPPPAPLALARSSGA